MVELFSSYSEVLPFKSDLHLLLNEASSSSLKGNKLFSFVVLFPNCFEPFEPVCLPGFLFLFSYVMINPARFFCLIKMRGLKKHCCQSISFILWKTPTIRFYKSIPMKRRLGSKNLKACQSELSWKIFHLQLQTPLEYSLLIIIIKKIDGAIVNFESTLLTKT